MYYTVTFNPCIDYIMYTHDIIKGELNRSTKESAYVGGKGINVSLVLKELGKESTALGFTGGFTGTYIEENLQKSGIKTDFVKVRNGFSRINVKIKSGTETEINGCGPDIGKEEIESFMKKLDSVKSGDTLILSGSIPSSLPDDMYEKILSYVKGKNVRCVVDTSRELLKNALKYELFLVKPNLKELEELFETEIKTKDELIHYGKILKRKAKNVLVSMGKDGAMLIDENDEIFFKKAPQGKIINTVGAGDSMVAGFLYGYDNDRKNALRYAVLSGSATAFKEDLCNLQDIERIFKITD